MHYNTYKDGCCYQSEGYRGNHYIPVTIYWITKGNFLNKERMVYNKEGKKAVAYGIKSEEGKDKTGKKRKKSAKNTNGAVTAAEVYAVGYVSGLEPAGHSYSREDYMAVSHGDKFIVAVDIEGNLKWDSGYAVQPGRPKAHVIEVLTENVSDDYLALLRKKGVSYIFAGKETLDMGIVLQKLKRLFQIDTLMIAGGGIVNWSFLEAGCIDELSLILSPLADGRTDTATLFDRSAYQKKGTTVAFSLIDVQKLEGDGFLCQRIAYALCILGICMDVPPFGLPLGHGGENSRENVQKSFCCTEMDCPYGCSCHCGVWDIRFCEAGNWQLYADAGSVCVFWFSAYAIPPYIP